METLPQDRRTTELQLDRPSSGSLVYLDSYLENDILQEIGSYETFPNEQQIRSHRIPLFVKTCAIIAYFVGAILLSALGGYIGYRSYLSSGSVERFTMIAVGPVTFICVFSCSCVSFLVVFRKDL